MIVADAGYGSEENYEYLERQDRRAFVKYNSFHREQKKSYATEAFAISNWPYDPKGDTYTCPGNKTLSHAYTTHPTTALGYTSTVEVNECDNCQGRHHRSRCIKSEDPSYNRRIKINERQLELRRKAALLLKSEEGVALRKQRGIDVETVFGDVKQNWHFTRFMMRGIEKASTE